MAMLSSSSSYESTRLFTNDWVITVPTYPSLKFYRCSPKFFNDSLELNADPQNNPFAASSLQNRVHDAETYIADKRSLLQSYCDSAQKHHALHFIVKLDDHTVGSGGIMGRGE
jgi:hypothetical protein